VGSSSTSAQAVVVAARLIDGADAPSFKAADSGCAP
jgi:hypothetical protein